MRSTKTFIPCCYSNRKEKGGIIHFLPTSLSKYNHLTFRISTDSSNNKNTFLFLSFRICVYVCVCVQFIVKNVTQVVADLSSDVIARIEIHNFPKAKTNCLVASHAKSSKVLPFRFRLFYPLFLFVLHLKSFYKYI